MSAGVTQFTYLPQFIQSNQIVIGIIWKLPLHDNKLIWKSLWGKLLQAFLVSMLSSNGNPSIYCFSFSLSPMTKLPNRPNHIKSVCIVISKRTKNNFSSKINFPINFLIEKSDRLVPSSAALLECCSTQEQLLLRPCISSVLWRSFWYDAKLLWLLIQPKSWKKHFFSPFLPSPHGLNRLTWLPG